MAQEYAKGFYNSKLWKNVRENVLRRDFYTCQKCGAPAEEVHHIIHISKENVNDLSITCNENNLISLCWLCHKREHADDGKDHNIKQNVYCFDEFGYCIPVNPPHTDSKN